MVLSDQDIWKALASKRLVIKPTPDPERIVGHTIDLLLHKEIIIFPTRDKGISVFTPHIAVNETLKKLGEPKKLTERGT